MTICKKCRTYYPDGKPCPVCTSKSGFDFTKIFELTSRKYDRKGPTDFLKIKKMLNNAVKNRNISLIEDYYNYFDGLSYVCSKFYRIANSIEEILEIIEEGDYNDAQYCADELELPTDNVYTFIPSREDLQIIPYMTEEGIYTSVVRDYPSDCTHFNLNKNSDLMKFNKIADTLYQYEIFVEEKGLISGLRRILYVSILDPLTESLERVRLRICKERKNELYVEPLHFYFKDEIDYQWSLESWHGNRFAVKDDYFEFSLHTPMEFTDLITAFCDQKTSLKWLHGRIPFDKVTSVIETNPSGDTGFIFIRLQDDYTLTELML